MGNKDNCELNRTAPVPWPSPLTRVVSLDSLSPVLSLTDLCVSWIPPQLVTSLETPLGPGWHPRTHILSFTYPAQGINCLNLITMEEGTGAPYSRLTIIQLNMNNFVVSRVCQYYSDVRTCSASSLVSNCAGIIHEFQHTCVKFPCFQPSLVPDQVL